MKKTIIKYAKYAKIAIVIIISIFVLSQIVSAQENNNENIQNNNNIVENNNNEWDLGLNFQVEFALSSGFSYFWSLNYSIPIRLDVNFLVTDWLGIGLSGSIGFIHSGAVSSIIGSARMLVNFNIPIVKHNLFEMYIPILFDAGYESSSVDLNAYSGIKFYFNDYIGLRLLAGIGYKRMLSLQLSFLVRLGH